MLVDYQLADSIATITMDDRKVNALSPTMLGELNAAFDRAQADRAVVVLTGRDKVFSAGFDLAVLRAGGEAAIGMVRDGFELAYRVLGFPQPVVVAATGHAMAMGVFLMLAGDYRIGADAPYKMAANEVAIGLTVPLAAIEILRYRLTPSAADRAAILAETFTPDTAVAAGLLDRVVPGWDLAGAARELATALSTLDRGALAGTKARARQGVLERMRAALEAEDVGKLIAT
jgi:enoyl-CoA hydratase